MGKLRLKMGLNHLPRAIQILEQFLNSGSLTHWIHPSRPPTLLPLPLPLLTALCCNWFLCIRTLPPRLHYNAMSVRKPTTSWGPVRTQALETDLHLKPYVWPSKINLSDLLLPYLQNGQNNNCRGDEGLAKIINAEPLHSALNVSSLGKR